MLPNSWRKKRKIQAVQTRAIFISINSSSPEPKTASLSCSRIISSKAWCHQIAEAKKQAPITSTYNFMPPFQEPPSASIYLAPWSKAAAKKNQFEPSHSKFLGNDPVTVFFLQIFGTFWKSQHPLLWYSAANRIQHFRRLPQTKPHTTPKSTSMGSSEVSHSSMTCVKATESKGSRLIKRKSGYGKEVRAWKTYKEIL